MGKTEFEWHDDLQTLALAKAILQNDAAAAEEALKNGGNPKAYWIDGSTTLHDRAVKSSSSSESLKSLFTSKNFGKILRLAEEPDLWTQSFVLFAARRGYDFECRPDGSHSRLIKIGTTKGILSRIWRKWDLIKDARCSDVESESRSRWTLYFGERWSDSVDRFEIHFSIDASTWEVLRQFNTARDEGHIAQPLDENDTLIWPQKNWEAESKTYSLLGEKAQYTVADMVSCMKKGGSPFTRFDGFYADEIDPHPSVSAFMETVREELGDEPGWHLRMPALLTKEGLKDLYAKAELRLRATSS
ncbi:MULTISPECIES: hypothetical protein [unclassified Duganella]|uniref:hypothetical protein n=1 Tax=unclassified Duganella TaxID=2636909 RepID=UPI00088C7CD0|nr:MULTISPECIES: hypothetical protein [unclassified Duganella]SDF37878.1 hypothetical protein SAMN05216320_1012 [Duganella sp. OV458]SDI88488.1 hypothetical protein SAMN05428973_1011423 [Duganella sp. OV510]